MKTEPEEKEGRITPEQYREIRALCEYWFDRIAGDFDETDPRHEEERTSREALRARLNDREERFDCDVRRIAYLEAYHLRLRRDLRMVESLFDCLESKVAGRPPDHCYWDPLLTALEEWKEPLYENLPEPDPLRPPPWAPPPPLPSPHTP